MLRKGDLTQGGITTTLLQFTLPMLAGSLLQQCYNIADTLIVGQCIGTNALAAVGSAYTLMVFLISILLGLSMGSGTVFSLQYGAGDLSALRRSIYVSFLLIGTVTILLNVAVFLWLDPILRWLQVPYDIYSLMRNYLWIIFWGIVFTFLYNFYAALLRAVGDSVTPSWFLAVSVVLNIGLDLFLILVLDQGIEGAAVATVIAQGTAASGILLYTYKIRPELLLHREDMRFDRSSLREITSFSTLTCVQQSVMNFGILMVQGLVNSFGTVVMAAFAAAVKIDSFAYMPVQEFGFMMTAIMAAKQGTDAMAAHQVGMNIMSLSFAFGDGLQSAAVALIGRSLGAKKPELAKEYGRTCRLIGAGIAVCLVAIYLFGGRWLYSLFFEEQHIIEIGVSIIHVIIFVVIFQICQVIYMGCLRGAGDTLYTAVASMISVTFIRTIVSYLGGYTLGLGIVGIWFGVLADQMSRFIFATVRFKQGKWVKIKI